MVAMKYRCACTTLKGRRCRNSFSFICNKARVCYVHASKTYLKYVLNIQKAYKGYRCRKYVRLLARLPCDIQERILFYMHEHLYNARRNQCIKKILCKKFVRFIGIPINIGSNFTSVFLAHYRTRISAMNKTQFCNHVLTITHLYKLYTKYMTIVDTNYANALYHVSNIVKKDIQDCLYYYHHVGEQPYLYSNTELLELHKNVSELQKNIGVFRLEYKDRFCLFC